LLLQTEVLGESQTKKESALNTRNLNNKKIKIRTMKKLAILAVFVLGMISFSANAQQEGKTKAMDSTAKTMQVKDNFKEIDKSQLPQAIKDAIMTDMDGMMVSKAYIGEESIFKIIVASLKDKSMTKTVYADAQGNWIKPKDDSMN